MYRVVLIQLFPLLLTIGTQFTLIQDENKSKKPSHIIFAFMEVRSFEFSPFSENTYVLFDETKECAILDPGCYNASERQALSEFIDNQGLKPVLLLNTHCHLDHIFGNAWVCEKYDLEVHGHELEQQVMDFAGPSAQMYGVQLDPSPKITQFLEPNTKISFGNTELDMVFTPGHSPGSISFLHHPSKTAIVGDVLFLDSIGRTDLPGGDFDTLIQNIRTELLTLSDEWTVYNGHGPSTTIGRERRYNPFLRK